MDADDEALGRFFDGVARGGAMATFEAGEEERLARCFARWGLRPGDRVVEPGCGSGRLTERLAAAVGPGGEVLAFDVSEAMVERARGRGLPSHARVERATVTAIPAPDAGFDQALLLHAFPHFAARAEALLELARVVRPGGTLWIEHLAARAEVNAFHAQAAPEIADHAIPDAAGVRSSLERAGFEVELLEDRVDGYTVRARRRAPGED